MFTSTAHGELGLETLCSQKRRDFRLHLGPTPMFFSWAPDKSRVGSKSVQNFMCVLPDNTGFPSPPAVTS